MSSGDDVQQPDLFKGSLPSVHDPILSSVGPLAERFRPHTFSEFFGQKHLLSENQALRQAIETDQVPSLIFAFGSKFGADSRVQPKFDSSMIFHVRLKFSLVSS